MKYFCEITNWGPEALAFLENPEANFIIIFNDNAPAELKEFSVVHTTGQYNDDPVVGDTFIIANKAFNITAIGDEVLHTLKTMGHCTVSFNGGDKPERPGCLMLQGNEPLLPTDIKIGSTIEIH